MPSLRPSAPSKGAHQRIKSMQIYKLFVTLATHTSISISHQLSAALRHPLSEVFPTPSATTEAQPSSPHAPPTAKEVKSSTSPANPSQALFQATLPYYQPSPSLPKETPPLYKPIEATTIWRLLHRVSPSIYYAKATHAQPHYRPLRSDTQALRLIANILLIQQRKKCCSREGKAPSRSDFSVSTYVVLKTRHANPNIHVRRFIVHARSPNLSATRP